MFARCMASLARVHCIDRARVTNPAAGSLFGICVTETPGGEPWTCIENLGLRLPQRRSRRSARAVMRRKRRARALAVEERGDVRPDLARAALADQQIEVAVVVLVAIRLAEHQELRRLERLADPVVDADEVDWLPLLLTRGLRSLPVRYGAPRTG